MLANYTSYKQIGEIDGFLLVSVILPHDTESKVCGFTTTAEVQLFLKSTQNRHMIRYIIDDLVSQLKANYTNRDKTRSGLLLACKFKRQ